MKSQRSIKNFSKKLVDLSKDADFISNEKVSAILHVLKKQNQPQLLDILTNFRKKLESELKKENALIESAQTLSDDLLSSIQNKISSHYHRNIKITQKINPDLLAGYRIHIADDLWDTSAKGRLQELSKSL